MVTTVTTVSVTSVVLSLSTGSVEIIGPDVSGTVPHFVTVTVAGCSVTYENMELIPHINAEMRKMQLVL